MTFGELLGIVWVSVTFGELLGIVWVSVTFGARLGIVWVSVTFGELLLHWAGSERRPGDGSSGAGHPGRGVRRIVDRTLSQMTEHPSTLSNHWPKPEVCTLLYKYWPEVCTLLYKYWPKQNSGGEDGGLGVRNYVPCGG